jgi:phosphatidate cytidylyltransferase
MTSSNGPPDGPRLPNELMMRIVSALVLVALALGAVWAGAWPFGLLLAVGSGIASWEWGRVVRGVATDGLLILHVAAVVLAVAMAIAGYGVPAAVGLLVVAIVMLVLRWRERDLLTGAGVLVTGLPGISLAWLRTDPTHGLAAVLFVFAVVWATDIGGYVFGRSLGGPKLWVRVSPNKTWAGAIGGLLLAAVAGVLAGRFVSSPDLIGVSLVAILLSVAAILGDLAESAFKRRFGRKDASNLIPGHGGILDRVDALMAAASVAAMFAMLRDPVNPGAGLLFLP